MKVIFNCNLCGCFQHPYFFTNLIEGLFYPIPLIRVWVYMLGPERWWTIRG